ncbi:MAG: transposase [Flavobacteriales bacterium]|nr:transposase [Flavobacteriales bacterium]
MRHSTGGTLDATLDLFFDEDAETQISKRNLPHWRQEGRLYFVTWRLADSLPSEKREQLRQDREDWQRQHGKKDRKNLTLVQRRSYYQLFHQRVQQWLDAGSGSCILRQEGPLRTMVAALHHFDHERYRLGHFAVAANHVHVLVRPYTGHSLSGILHSWKSFTAKAINKLLGRSGQLWQDESYDHLVRSEEALERIQAYILAHRASGGYVEEHGS